MKVVKRRRSGRKRDPQSRIRTVGDFARLDIGRAERTGVPEVVVAEGKTPKQLNSIIAAYASERPRIIVSRMSPAAFREIKPVPGRRLRYFEDARTLLVVKPGARPARTGGRIAIVAAGTTDVAVGEEARLVAEEMGVRVDTYYDVGVAGISRLLAVVNKLKKADAIIAVAGREAALAPVVAGLVDKPVIGLPVSSGYGVGGKGEAALKAMLQSCAPLTVTNIDAGVVAGACAAQIAINAAKARSKARPGRGRRASRVGKRGK